MNTSTHQPEGVHAIVFGASGLNGWAVVNELLLNYPKPRTFSRVIALTNRPLDLEKSYWPLSAPERPELVLASSVNLVEGSSEDVAALLKVKVPDVEKVTHVFYFAHKTSSINLKDEKDINIAMLERTIGAMNIVAPNLDFVAYPGGAMVYGMYAPGGTYKAPLHEDLPPVSRPLSDTIPYPELRKVLDKAMQGRSWRWSEVCMDIIVGFAPNGSVWSLAGHWATYLSCYRLVEGEGVEVHFPGTEAAYDALFNESSSATVARAAIWASMNPEETNRKMFNIGDQSRPSNMRERWPVIAGWFGLKGIAPAQHPEKLLKPSEYIGKHKGDLRQRGFEGELALNAGWLDGYGFACDFDRHFSLQKVKNAGFDEEFDPNQSWLKAFDRFKQAGLIPSV